MAYAESRKSLHRFDDRVVVARPERPLTPMERLEFQLGDDVARVRERRLPATVVAVQEGPSGMIDVQVGEGEHIDVIGMNAQRSKSVQELAGVVSADCVVALHVA
jgi:hypothetical protein